MAEPISILELQQEDGSIIELPVMQGDTPEVLSNVLKKNGYDPSKYSNEITQALGGGGGNEDLVDANINPLTPVYKEKDKPSGQSNEYIKKVQDYARSLPFGSKEQKKAYDVLTKELTASKGTTQKSGGTPPKFTSGDREDISNFRNVLNLLPQLLETKNSGFGGKGIDTGPIVGGGIPKPFGGGEVWNFVPAGASEWFNKTFGGEDNVENASDRAKLRQLEKLLFNPVKKEISGTAVSNQERFADLLPMLPSETDNDQAFFNKGFKSYTTTLDKLKTMLDTAQKSGIDISEYKDIMNLDPQKELENLMKQLSQNQKGSFARELPDTFKKFQNNTNKSQGNVIDLSNY